ncbi:MAG: AraC family transcriptional regulator [Victivallaceae bacterium]
MEFFPLKTGTATGEEIENALCAIENAFSIAITVHDLQGRLHGGNKDPLLPLYRKVHQHPCCLRERYRETGWSARCTSDCFTISEQVADEQAKPYLKTCWKGLQELVVPVMHNSQHLLTLYAGVFRCEARPPEGAPTQKWFRNLYMSLPTALDEKNVQVLSVMLEMLGHGLIAIGLRPSAHKETNPRTAALTGFIADNAHRQITLADMAKHLHLSPSRAAHLAVELTGSSFQALLLQERMARARNLLISTGQKQEEISSAIGFKNCYYFNRTFKKYFGETPGKYRQKHNS